MSRVRASSCASSMPRASRANFRCWIREEWRIVQSDGVSTSDPDDVIDQDVSVGTYYLKVSSAVGTRARTRSRPRWLPPPRRLRRFLWEAPTSIVAGDFAGSGKLDLAVDDASGIYILLGNGDGTFQPPQLIAGGLDDGPLVDGVFTGDGKLDLVVDCSNGIEILPGNGDGTFGAPQLVGAGLVGPMVAGAFTRDGNLDLAVDVFDGVELLLGNGDGTFQPPQLVGAGLDGPLAAGDFNGNGKLDLAVSTTTGIAVLLGNGDGTFAPRSIPPPDSTVV